MLRVGMSTTAAATATPIPIHGAPATLVTSRIANGLWSSAGRTDRRVSALGTATHHPSHSVDDEQQYSQLFTYWFIYTPPARPPTSAAGIAGSGKSVSIAAAAAADTSVAAKLTGTCQQLMSWCTTVSQRLLCRRHRRADLASRVQQQFGRVQYRRQTSTATTSSTASGSPSDYDPAARPLVDDDDDLAVSKRYPILMCVKHPAQTAVDCCDVEKFLRLVHIWLDEQHLLRILFGASKRCSCTNVNHATANVRRLMADQHRTTILRLLGVSRIRFMRMLAQSKNVRLGDNQVFIDEYGALMWTFLAMGLPCNTARRDVCREFSLWLTHKIRHTHQHYRTKNLLAWERSVQRALVDQSRANSVLQYQYNDACKQLSKIKFMYETLLRSGKPAAGTDACVPDAQQK